MVHVQHEVLLARSPAEARVESTLLRHAGDGTAAVVVAGIEQAGVRQGEDLALDRLPELAGTALLKIAAAAAADQQGITGEGHRGVVKHIGEAAIGMPRCRPHQQRTAAERDAVAMGERPGDEVSPGNGRQADGAAAGGMEAPAGSDVIGVHVGIEGGHQLKPQLTDQGQITLLAFEHRIDQNRLGGRRIRQQVGEGAGVGILELAKQQGANPGGELGQGLSHQTLRMHL